MIFPDVNVLIYAHNSASPHHAPCRAAWERALRSDSVALSWIAVWGFLRLSTGSVPKPLSIDQAAGLVDFWMQHPNVAIVDPGPKHVEDMRALARSTQVVGRELTDVALACLALQSGASMLTTDSYFNRVPGLQVVNPLVTRN